MLLFFFGGGIPAGKGGGTGRDTCSLRVACTKALLPKPKSRKEGMIFFSLVRIFFLYWLQGVRSNCFHQLLSLLGIPGESPLVFLLFSLALCSGGRGGGGVAACSKSLFRNALLPWRRRAGKWHLCRTSLLSRQSKEERGDKRLNIFRLLPRVIGRSIQKKTQRGSNAPTRIFGTFFCPVFPLTSCGNPFQLSSEIPPPPQSPSLFELSLPPPPPPPFLPLPSGVAPAISILLL